MKLLIDAGMTPLEAIEAATANGPDTLGPQAPKSGLLREGYDADVIAFDVNPLDDITVWGDPDRVTLAGESAGGMSVGTLLGTPSAQGLFHRAILQSGAAHNVSTRDQARRVSENFLAKLRIDPEDPDRIWQGQDGGVAVSYDRGKTWEPIRNLRSRLFGRYLADDVKIDGKLLRDANGDTALMHAADNDH